MRKLKWGVFFLLLLSFIAPVQAQNVSNRGRVFWVGHMGHIDGTGSNFALYITTDASTSALVRVSIPGGTYNSLVVVPSNQVVVVTLPSNQTYMNCTDCILDRGVKIESLNQDIVVYAHIYSNARSDATLLIPVETLGKEYYAIAFTQNPSGSSQRSEFMLVGVEDSTYIDIYPTSDILPNKPKNKMYTVMLNEGEIYHAQSLSDVSGTRLVARSSNGISCKKVAAFSGSSFTRVGCSNASTGDNLYQQLFPTTSWGMEFVTAPLKSRNGDQFRVLAKYDSTKVTINGGTPLYLDEGKYYSFVSYEANYVLTDKPVTLAQYPRTQNCDGNTGDPTLIVIPPIEQMVKYVAMYSSPYQNITGQYLNIITKTSDTGSFMIDNQKVEFTSMSNKPQFAYAQLSVNSGLHQMNSDSSFQVVAYGFGYVEAYGYAGGTNIKNLVQSISSSADSICLGDTLNMKAEVNYQPTYLMWYFGDGTTDSGNYQISKIYTSPGKYPVSLVTRKEGLVDCGSTDSTVYWIRVHGYPTANFSVQGNCLNDSIKFKDISIPNTSYSYVSKWEWTFGDSILKQTQHVARKFHRYDSMPTRLVVWNNNLCSDTFWADHFVNPNPTVDYQKNDTCPGKIIQFLDLSYLPQGNIDSSIWYFDSSQTFTGRQIPFATLVEGGHRFDLLVKSDSGCTEVKYDSFWIYPKPTAKFTVTNACFSHEIHVNDSSVLATGWEWDYSDTSFTGAPVPYIFNDSGLYPIHLKVKSSNGCLDSFSRIVSIYPNPLSHWKSEGNCTSDLYTFSPDFDTTNYPDWQYHWEIEGSQYMGTTQLRNFTSGWKSVKLAVQSADNCSDSSRGKVFVNLNPLAKTQFAPNCEFEKGTLIDVSDYQGSSEHIRRWDWGNLQFTDSVNLITPIKGGIRWIQLTVTTDSNCVDTASQFLEIWDLPNADFTTLGNCPMAIVSHKDQTVIVSSDPLVSWNWTVSQGENGQSDTFNWVPAKGGDYTVTEIVVSQKGCTDTLQKNIHVLDIPAVSVEEITSCVEFVAELHDHSTSSEQQITNWDWIWDGQSYIGQDVSEIFADSGSYNYSLSLTTNAGCIFKDIFSDSIYIYPKPTAAFSHSPDFVLLDKPKIQFLNQTIGASEFQWYFGDDAISGVTSPTHAYTDTGRFEVKLWVKNRFGCTDSTFDTVWVRPMLQCFIPNAFTPNHDRLNESFGPKCEGVRNFKMTIYNRWGQEIFHTENGELWDPMQQGIEIVPDGIYVYYIVAYDFRGTPQFFRGNVVVLH
ncbi:MAG: PKD domain-containing protein [Bacteroidetes bacterium]|nr:PKD domain-containing protein [Bacteroidota bacterium]